MLTQEDDVDIHALRRRGWSISAIARHVGRDRKTVRAYLEGKRQVGRRAPAGGDEFARFVDYAAARLLEDPHLWATALHDEVVKLGYGRSYPSFTRALRLRGLRPAGEPCHPTRGRPAAVIEHPAGEETQWDWVELPDPPPGWDGYGKRAYLLVGALSHSSKWRGVLCESMEQPQLAEAQYQVAVKLGGVSKEWRFDRMATVVHPGSGKVTVTYAPIAKHFGVTVRPCPPRRGNRKGVVEKATSSIVRDNVVFELGLFIGALGSDRVYIVADPKVTLRLPTDLAGVTWAPYRERADGNMASAVGTAATLIGTRIRQLGRRATVALQGAVPTGTGLPGIRSRASST